MTYVGRDVAIVVQLQLQPRCHCVRPVCTRLISVVVTVEDNTLLILTVEDILSSIVIGTSSTSTSN